VTTLASKELSFLETGWLLALEWLLVLDFISSIASSVLYLSLRNVFISSQVGMSDLDERDCSHKERVNFNNLLTHRNTRRQSQFSVEMLEWASAIKHHWIVLCRSFKAWPDSELTELQLKRSLSWLFISSLLFSKRSRSAAHAESKPSFMRGDFATIALASSLVLPLRWKSFSTDVNLELLT